MSENPSQQTRIENLLSQDAAVSAFQFEEFRMRLETSIQELEQRARFVNRAALWGAGIMVLIIVSVLPLEGLGLGKNNWVMFMWAGCGQVVFFTTAVLTGLYQYRYKPALDRAKSDLQTTMMAQLQQQVAEISRKLEQR